MFYYKNSSVCEQVVTKEDSFIADIFIEILNILHKNVVKKQRKKKNILNKMIQRRCCDFYGLWVVWDEIIWNHKKSTHTKVKSTKEWKKAASNNDQMLKILFKLVVELVVLVALFNDKKELYVCFFSKLWCCWWCVVLYILIGRH